jgi:ParB family chromosome partitioning protein
MNSIQEKAQEGSKTPEIISVSLAKIKASTQNPRHVITQEMIDVCAASMKAIGQETPLKVRKCESVESGNDIQYELIGGHIRLEAAKRLGWESLNALVLDLTPEQAELAAIMDNQGEDMHWLDWYQAIERRMNGPEKRTQQQVAEELGVSQQMVSKAVRLLKVLNQSSREAIYYTVVKAETEYQLPANTALLLTALEDPQKVETALKVVIDKKLTEPQAKRLVKWVKAGNKPEEYGKQPEDTETPTSNTKTPSLQENRQPDIPTSANAPIGAPPLDDGLATEALAEVGKLDLPDSNDPNAGLWVGLPEGFKIFKTPGKYQVIWLLDEAEAAVAVYGAMGAVDRLKGVNDSKWEKELEGMIEKANTEKPTANAKTPSRQENLPNEKPEVATADITKTSEPQAGIAAPPYAEASGDRSQTPLSAEAACSSELEERSEIAKADRNDNNKSSIGLLDHVKSMVKDQLKTAPGEVTDDLVRDGKSAVNTVIKQAMRRYIRDMF